VKYLSDIPTIPKEIIEEIAGEAKKDDPKPAAQGKGKGKKSSPRGAQGSSLGPLDVEKYLNEFGVPFLSPKRHKTKSITIYNLHSCLFDPSHGRKHASITQGDDGTLGYQCFSTTCTNDPAVNWVNARKQISGDQYLTEWRRGYNPDYKPRRQRPDPAGDSPDSPDPRRAFLTIMDNGRVSFNPALMAKHLRKLFDPIINEGEDFGSLYYHYNSAGTWKLLPVAEINKTSARILEEHALTRRVKDAVKLLEWEAFQDAQKLKSDPMYLNLQNCMLHIPTRKTVDHAPEFNSRTQLPVKYNAKAKCNLWIETLAEIFEDDLSKASVMQEFFGYCLYPKIMFPAAMFQIGSGANGKGTVQKVLEAMLGDDNVSHISLTRMEEKFGPAELKDKLLNACGETSTKPLEVTRFKEVAAGDKVQAEQKYKNDIIFVPIAKQMVSMNEFPGIKDKTHAFFRRIIVMEYKQKFEGKTDDRSLSDKLLKELDGIFLWSLEGLKRVLENEAIIIPESVEQAKKRFKARVNPVIMFVDEECRLSAEATASPPDVFRRYNEWCDDAKTRSVGKTRFYELIQTNFNVSRFRPTKNSKELFKGIGLVDHDQVSL